MPPEEANCLVAMQLERQGQTLNAHGERVFAKSSRSPATVTWYTATDEPPSGYSDVLGGLVFVRTRTLGDRSVISNLSVPFVDERFSWKDNAHSKGLMIAVALPHGMTIEAPMPSIAEAKQHRGSIAVYWHLRAAVSSYGQVEVSFGLRDSTRPVGTEVERLNRAVSLARSRPASAKYDVALSFAGEQRRYVHQVAEALSEKGVTVFYDNFETADLWGKNLHTHLEEVYGRKARFTVMFLSDAYARKVWTKHERKAAQARAATMNADYILPVRFDETRIPGLSAKVAYLKAEDYTPERLSDEIIKKLRLSHAENDA